MKVLALKIADYGAECEVTLLNVEEFVYETYHFKQNEPVLLTKDHIKALVGDFDHPHYERVIKSQINYRSFDLTVEKTEKPVAVHKIKAKKKETFEQGEVEFPSLHTCLARTKAGKPCKREPLKNGYCSLHQPNEEE